MRKLLTEYLITLTAAVIYFSFVPLRCETDVKECATPDRCQNNGSCQDFNGTYNCTCTELFAGYNCEVSVSKLFLSNSFFFNDRACGSAVVQWLSARFKTEGLQVRASPA